MVMIGASQLDTISNVDLDNVEAGARITEFLLELGHRRIAFISGPDFVKSALLRHEGYRRALSEWCVEVDPALELMNVVWESDKPMRIRALLELPASRRPTAIFCWHDAAALEAIRIAQSLKLDVPTDLTVVGIDDVPSALECCPPLTTLRQPYTRIGQASVQIAISQVLGEEAEVRQLVFAGDLIVRRSAAPPAHA